jgi:hypothetical protein
VAASGSQLTSYTLVNWPLLKAYGKTRSSIPVPTRQARPVTLQGVARDKDESYVKRFSVLFAELGFCRSAGLEAG